MNITYENLMKVNDIAASERSADFIGFLYLKATNIDQEIEENLYSPDTLFEDDPKLRLLPHRQSLTYIITK